MAFIFEDIKLIVQASKLRLLTGEHMTAELTLHLGFWGSS